jgi:uncharacterized 2Fe-2S/4Fe-4S cluster protein (DUF4445 family)
MPPTQRDKIMPILRVEFEESVVDVPYVPGPSVRELIQAAGIPLRCGCRGNGACGLCLVRIESGTVEAPTVSEQCILSREQIDRNVRFACRLMPKDDLTVRVMAAPEKSPWRALSGNDLPYSKSPAGSFTRDESIPRAYGVAIDMGTTHISLSLWDLASGIRLAGRFGLNPQAVFGADVISRLEAVSESPDCAERIAAEPLTAVSEALREICSDNGLCMEHVTRVALVGNTAMLLLLTMSNPQALLKPGNWSRPLSFCLENPSDWIRTLRIHPKATVDLAQPLAGFVGSDLLAGILATGLIMRPKRLLIDFGTNSEIALWDGLSLWVTSAAGGPAFETSRVQCGMPAETGAISRVSRDENSSRFHFEIIGAGEAKGLCGSGLVDLIACLRRGEELSATGRFSGPNCRDGFPIPNGNRTLRLSHSDVDMFQRAKAGIGAGVAALLSSAKITVSELDRVYVCGVFGSKLNIRNAQAIGLLPNIAPERIELCGNTALSGCELLLLTPPLAGAMARLRAHTVIVNAATAPDFESRFIENLYLQPITDDPK